MKKISLLLGASALHLRATFLALAPILPLLQAHFGLDHATTGLLTTLPLLVFAAVSPFVGTAATRLGTARLFAIAMTAIGVGAAVRSYTGVAGLFAGTVVLAAGVAVGNVLLPAAVKEHYPGREGAATGVLIALMNGTNALWTAAVVPVTAWLGWQLALGWWTLPALALAAAWAMAHEEPREKASFVRMSVRELFSRPTAWWVSLFIGIQSLVFFSFVAWLPYWTADKGFSAAAAGLYMFLFQLLSLPAALVAPMLAMGPRRQWVTMTTCLLYLASVLAVFYAATPMAMTLSVAVAGLASGATFSICMLAFPLRSGTLAIASRLTGVGQAIGYLLAAIGPVGIGKLYSLIGAWEPVLPVFIIACLLMTLCGWHAMAQGRIGEEL